jgi:predicted Zn-dependent protease
MAFRRFYRRTFLNKRGHHAGAYVLADVSLERGMLSDDGTDVCAQLTVADCGRITQLDFDVHDRDTAANALHKARVLKTVVDRFVDALESAVAESGADSRADKPTRR